MERRGCFCIMRGFILGRGDVCFSEIFLRLVCDPQEWKIYNY